MASENQFGKFYSLLYFYSSLCETPPIMELGANAPPLQEFV